MKIFSQNNSIMMGKYVLQFSEYMEATNFPVL